MVSLSTKFQAHMVDKHEQLTAKEKQLEKLIHQIALLTKTNTILVKKVTSIGGGDGRA